MPVGWWFVPSGCHQPSKIKGCVIPGTMDYRTEAHKTTESLLLLHCRQQSGLIVDGYLEFPLAGMFDIIIPSSLYPPPLELLLV